MKKEELVIKVGCTCDCHTRTGRCGIVACCSTPWSPVMRLEFPADEDETIQKLIEDGALDSLLKP